MLISPQTLSFKDDEAFCKIYPLILGLEGGYVSPEKAEAIHDTGGATAFGISFNFNRAELAHYGIDKPEEMQYLKQDQAIEIYYRKYWLGSGCPSIRSLRIQLIHFDTAVNQGVGGAMWFMGRAGNDFKNYLSLRELAYKGNPAIPDWLHSNPATREKCLKGWMNRLARIEKDAETLA